MASEEGKMLTSRSAGFSSMQQISLQTMVPPPPLVTLKDLQEALKRQTQEIDFKFQEVLVKFGFATKSPEDVMEEKGASKENISHDKEDIRQEKMVEKQNKAERLEDGNKILQDWGMDPVWRRKQDKLRVINVKNFVQVLGWREEDFTRDIDKILSFNFLIWRQKELLRDNEIYLLSVIRNEIILKIPLRKAVKKKKKEFVFLVDDMG